MNEPKAVLISHTNKPIETMYLLWQCSKESNFTMTLDEVSEKMNSDESFKNEVYSLFQKILNQNIPVAENISFTFLIKNDPIAHREQMVRHRIGTSYGDNYGVDIIPDLAKSTWWSQSMRILDCSNFVNNDNYFVPDSIKNDSDALNIYMETLLSIQKGYSDLVKLGIPLEDARGLMPLHTTMDISWTVNLSSLLHIIGKRSCWILQYGYWGSIIKTMVDELVKIDPIFRDMILPPCFQNGEFSECTYKLENERRCDQRDKLPVCPLYFYNHMDGDGVKKYVDIASDEILNLGESLIDKYENLWGRNSRDGKKL